MNLVHYKGLPRGEKLDFHDQIDVLWVFEGPAPCACLCVCARARVCVCVCVCACVCVCV